jgi:hypothetical protein
MDVRALDDRLLEVLVTRVAPAPCVSIYLPLTTEADASERVRAGLATLTRAASDDLCALGASPQAVLGPLQRHTEEPRAWPRNARGLGIFAARGMLAAYSVSHPVPMLAQVGPRVHIRPLLGFCWCRPRSA